MVQKIALFNHKGGVSKTTTAFNLGWILASKGKTVILADTDPRRSWCSKFFLPCRGVACNLPKARFSFNS